MIKNKTTIKTIIYVTTILIFSSVALYSLSFSEKIDKADKLLRDSRIDYQAGDYDSSYQKSQAAQALLLEIERLYPLMHRLYILDHQLTVARQIQAHINSETKESYEQARNHYYQASDFIEKGNPTLASAAVEKGLALIKKVIEEAKKPRQLEVTKVQIGKAKGKFYVVQLVPEKRDCLWRIAGYDYIYNDPFKWTLIYEANKSQIKNPNLIYPKQKLIIPPLANLEKNNNK